MHPTALVLVVDDEPVSRAMHRGIVAKAFDVVTASSGREALSICQRDVPEIILLDVEMPEMDGIETCRKLREFTTVPVIFVTSHESLEEHILAFEAGGTDIIVKPVHSEILMHKVVLAVRQFREAQSLSVEKNSLERMAMSFLSSVGQTGALLNFMRASVMCRTHRALAEKLASTLNDLGVKGSLMIRHDSDSTMLTTHGDPSPIEQAIRERSSLMGRNFQFKRQFVVNYDHVTLIVTNLPLDEELAGRIRDNVTILAETMEGLSEIVDTRQESNARAEHLQVALSEAESAIERMRISYSNDLADTRILFQDLIDDIERSFAFLETNSDRESEISEMMARSIQGILTRLQSAGNFEQQFHEVIDALRTSGSESPTLF